MIDDRSIVMSLFYFIYTGETLVKKKSFKIKKNSKI